MQRSVFVGPCSAKKLEAMRESVRSEVDFVLTFEEMAGMMSAKQIDYTKLAGEGGDFDVASADGRGFAVAGGRGDGRGQRHSQALPRATRSRWPTPRASRSAAS